MSNVLKRPIPFNQRFAYHFDLVPEANQQDQQHVIEEPTFGDNLVKQWEYLKKYQSLYNAHIKAKRQPLLDHLENLRLELANANALQRKGIEQQIKDLKKELSQEAYQQLRDVHFNLLKEIIVKARQQVAYNNTYLFAEGFNKIDPSQPYSVECSYPELAHRTGGCAQKTVYRRLIRLQTAGFFSSKEGVSGPISGKVFRGTNAPFELLISPQILLIWDRNNPDYTPLLSLPGKTKTLASPGGDSTNGHHINTLTRIDNSSIGDMWNLGTHSSSPNELLTAKAEQETPLARTPEKCKTGEKSLKLSDEGEKQRIKSLVQGKQKVWRAAHFHNDLEKYAFAQVVLLVQAAISLLWSKKDLHPGYLCRLEDYLLANYFKNKTSEAAIDQRAAQIVEVLKHNSEYINAKPNERFALLPHLYFSVKRKPTGPEDYSGFMGQVRLMKEKKTWNKFKELKKQQDQEHAYNREKTKFLRALKRYDRRDKGYKQAARLNRFVSDKCPSMKEHLDRYLAFNQWPEFEKATA